MNLMRIGIDPGSAGGIVTEYQGIVTARSMPDTDTDIIDHLRSCKETAEKDGAAISVMMEKVTGFIGFREKTHVTYCPKCRSQVWYKTKESDPASMMFTFGEGVGFLRAACMSLGFRYETVSPRTWQGAFGLVKSKGMSKTEWKNILKDKAKKLFPEIKVTLSTADALIILEYSKRVVSAYTPPKTNQNQEALPL